MPESNVTCGQREPEAQYYYSWRRVLSAVTINTGMGTLYLWSLFIVPLERDLSISRSSVSVVSSLSLIFFTIGMVVSERLHKHFSARPAVLLIFALAALGHAYYAAWPSFTSLLLGYGATFGLGCGLGYGLALALATATAPALRALAIGMTTSAFAVSGIVFSWLVSNLALITDTRWLFATLAGGLALLGATAFLLVGNGGGSRETLVDVSSHRAQGPRLQELLRLMTLFFLLCYPPLMIIAHSAALLLEVGLVSRYIFLGPVLLNAGYVLGSLSGAFIVARLGTSKTMRGAFLFLLLALLSLLFSGLSLIILTALLVIGFVFGSSASFMPALVGEQFGTDAISKIYGRLIIGYGLAGLLAPWITAYLFELSGGYSLPILLGTILAVCGLAISLLPTRG